jgi:hypothetical protein
MIVMFIHLKLLHTMKSNTEVTKELNGNTVYKNVIFSIGEHIRYHNSDVRIFMLK